jgi:hypothetical protein
VPVKREEIYRHLKLDLYGAQGQVNEATVVRLHDRRVMVDLDMFTRGSLNKELKGVDKSAEVVDTKHLQEAVANYASVMQILWPMDYSPSVISRVLIDARWGEVIGKDKLRTAVVKRFFSEVIRENCGRAVRREPPMVYSEAREKWLQVLESFVLQADRISILFNNTRMGSTSSVMAGGKPTSQKQNKAGPSGGKWRPNRPAASWNGVPVCYGYNSHTGCQRAKSGPSLWMWMWAWTWTWTRTWKWTTWAWKLRGKLPGYRHRHGHGHGHGLVSYSLLQN